MLTVKIRAAKKILLLVIIQTCMLQLTGCGQDQPNAGGQLKKTGQDQPQANPQRATDGKQVQQDDRAKQDQTLTSAQVKAIKDILSKYNPQTLTAADAKAIHQQFRAAGIHGGPETRSATVAAGFDPDKIRALDPPPDGGKKEQSPGRSDRMKIIEEKKITPLSVNTSQADAIRKAFTGFYDNVDALKKQQNDSHAPLEKTKMAPLEKTRDDQIRQVLSSDQFTRYLELEKTARPQKEKNGASK